MREHLQMDSATSHLLTLLGQLREGQIRQDTLLDMIVRHQRFMAKQQADILKAVSKPPPRLTIKRLWDDYLKPISSIAAWAPTAWVIHQVFSGGRVQDVLAKLAGYF